MNQSKLNNLLDTLNYLNQINDRFESTQPKEGTKEYVKEKVKLCLNNTHDLIAAEVNKASEPLSYCPQSSLSPWQKDFKSCLQKPCLCKHQSLAAASSPSGPSLASQAASGPASHSMTPATETCPEALESTTPRSEDEDASPSRPRLVYIAGPYWHNKPERRALHRDAARALAVQVAELGFFPVTPHLNTAGFENLASLPESFYRLGDLELLSKCEAILFVPGWHKSEGSQAEYDFAAIRSIPIFTDLKSLETHFAKKS